MIFNDELQVMVEQTQAKVSSVFVTEISTEIIIEAALNISRPLES
jgi:hypothetical protein